jgi:hypothetical protein
MKLNRIVNAFYINFKEAPRFFGVNLMPLLCGCREQSYISYMKQEGNYFKYTSFFVFLKPLSVEIL